MFNICMTVFSYFKFDYLKGGRNPSKLCEVEQLVARQSHKLKVTGSSPSPATNVMRFFFLASVHLRQKGQSRVQVA